MDSEKKEAKPELNFALVLSHITKYLLLCME